MSRQRSTIFYNGRACSSAPSKSQNISMNDGSNVQDIIDEIGNDVKTKISDDTFKWNYQSGIVADSAGVFGLTSITGYTPIFAYMIWPTDSAQRYIKIQYNPNQEKFFGNCGVANLGLEVRCLYVKERFN